ncbi:transmembrane protein 234 homolog, partial [Oppia nitens]|uniref:transmembrane protein 234 homolog n=1 Tax=Oppia nitens TaxID=1686743 RepID=UPI0023DB54F5
IPIEESILSMVITGFVWGISTPLIKRYSKDIDEVYHQNKVIEVFLQLKQLVTNWKYLFAFLVNQSGSILYAISLSYNPIIIAVPVTNAINFVSVVIFGPLLGEKALDSSND